PWEGRSPFLGVRTMSERKTKSVRQKGANAPVTGGAVRRGAGCSSLSPENTLKKSGADLAIEFLESLRIPEGPKAGELVQLATYQKDFIRGAMDPANMVAVLSIGRGNGKTALSAGLAL